MVLKEDLNAEDDVEGMVLNLPPHKENLNAEAFSNMKNLRLLKISNVHLPTGLNFLSNKLRMMEWHDYPLKFLPMSFQPDNLVELIMPRSHIKQLPVGFSKLTKLSLLDLSDSKVLVKTPNFIGCPDLERLIFQGCTSLYELHPSVGALKKLTLLNLKDCRSLAGLPCEINLKSLEIFILSGCSSLKKFSEIGKKMTRLSELYLDGTAVEELPSSLKRLTGLTVLTLQGCKNLSSFPNNVNLPSLKTLNLSGCKVQPPKSRLISHGFSLIRAAHVFFQGFFPIREAINLLLPRLRFIVSLNLADRNLWDGGLPDDLSGLSSLQELDMSKNNLTRLPDSISQLSKLHSLTLNDCSRLQSLPNLPLSVGFVTARRCPLLEKYSNQFAVWTSGETGFTLVDCDKAEGLTTPIPIPCLPYNDLDPLFERFVEGIIHQNCNYQHLSNSTETPEWFSHQSPGSSVTIPLPSNLHGDSNWIGIALFTRVVILENLNNVSSDGEDEVSIDFICRSDIIEGPCISCPLVNFSKALPGPLFHASSYGLKVIIPAGKLRDHLKDCSCLSAFIRKKCTYIEIETCGARVLYKQDLVKFIRASGKMKQRSKCYLDDKVECSKLCQVSSYSSLNIIFLK
ncbi:disease resistance-like protein DSC1 [Quercus robur]|uniref:disease resistance-like protein DSC1 n=1 Tax=Quercus robur TaxID=38942 RepID=UPI0021628EFC|nr:disease resistance-like protein DSC1 [Quercus robur]